MVVWMVYWLEFLTVERKVDVLVFSMAGQMVFSMVVQWVVLKASLMVVNSADW